ncbi:MAG TPA: large-conductance mechanosensitive channel protein MscL [Burkholderiales bacterium]|nr:large-conductance mechanosensitive channel protein MscL [Burkholderiales bacterium]
MSIAREFREFAVKGNVVDLAVAVIIGTAFGKIVASLVSDVVMPLVGALLGGVNFKGLAIQVGNAKIEYGNFVQTCVDFIIIAWAIFVAVKVINRLRKKDEDKPPAATPPRQEQLLEEIRDLLKPRQ